MSQRDSAVVAFAQEVAERLRAQAAVRERESESLLEAASKDSGHDFGHGEYDAAHKRLYAASELRAATAAVLADL